MSKHSIAAYTATKARMNLDEGASRPVSLFFLCLEVKKTKTTVCHVTETSQSRKSSVLKTFP